MYSIIMVPTKDPPNPMARHVSTKVILERAGMKPLSVEVMSRRWKMIHHLLRKDRNDDCNVALSWAPEGKRRRGRPKTTWRRTVEK